LSKFSTLSKTFRPFCDEFYSVGATAATSDVGIIIPTLAFKGLIHSKDFCKQWIREFSKYLWN